MGKTKRRQVFIEADDVGFSKRHSREQFKNMPKSKVFKPKSEKNVEYSIYDAAEDLAIDLMDNSNVSAVAVICNPYPVIMVYVVDIEDDQIPDQFSGFDVQVASFENMN